MLYSNIYQKLKTAFDKPEKEIQIDSLNLIIRKLDFNSDWDNGNSSKSLMDDSAIESNNSFQYYLFENLDKQKPKGVIFLFHGLNEKKWDKYLPWAYQLTKQTGKSVLLFPIAFHMNRAPLSWSDVRLMKTVSTARNEKSENTNSSFANAALSERLESYPERFYLSGLQTYIDVCKLIELIKANEIKEIPAVTNFDLFGYSIGAFLSLLLLMDNPLGFFTNSKLFMFCGGTTIDRIFPVSKYILDKLAYDSVTEYFNNFLCERIIHTSMLDNELGKFLCNESYFQSLISCNLEKELREKRLTEIGERISTIVLNQDEVIPPDGVIAELKGQYSKVKAKFEIRDFDYPYNHAIPFPLLEKYKLRVDNSFKSLFDNAAGFLV